MIRVRMRRDHRFDPMIPKRHETPELAEQLPAIRSPIDQHLRIAFGYQDGIALPDIEKYDSQRRELAE